MKRKSDPRHKKRQELVETLFSETFRDGKPGKKNLDEQKNILAHREEIDKLIAAAAPEFPIDKINKIDLAILRLAVYELTVANSNPEKVIIDEAIELGKEFGGDTSPAFINGVLGKILQLKQKLVYMQKNPETQIIDFFLNHFGMDKKDVEPSMELSKDLNLSTLEIADFFAALEDVFHIEIPKGESKKVQTVSDIINTAINNGSFT